MRIEIVTSVKDDFHESVGPSTSTMAFLSLDGMLFHLGHFYEGPYMNEEAGKRLSKILEFKEIINNIKGGDLNEQDIYT